MKLSENSLKILKNFSIFNPSILVRPGNVFSTIHRDKNFFAKATVSEEFKTEFAIYDLYQFLGVLSIFENPDLDFHEKMVYISENSSKIRYRFADPSMVIAAPSKNIELPSLKFEFDLKSSDLTSLSKSLNILDLPEFMIQGDGEDVIIAAVSSKDMESDQFHINVGKSSEEFRFFFPKEYVQMIPNDYHVYLTEVGLVEFKTENLSYYIKGMTK